MFNFYVVLAGHNNVSDKGTATMCRLKIKVPSLKTKSTKNEGPFENMSFSKNPFEDFNEKKTKKTFSLEQTTPCNTRPLNTTIEYCPCEQ